VTSHFGLGIDEGLRPLEKFLSVTLIVMRTRTRAIAVGAGLVALVALAACNQSRLDRGTPVTLTGQVVNQQPTRPVPATAVFLTRDLGPSDLLPGVLTAGLACLSADRPEICRSGVRHVTTGAEGRFAFHLKGGDTQTVFGNTRHFNLSVEQKPASGQVDGAGITGSFVIQTANLALPPLHFWEAARKLGSTAGTGTASWDALPATGYGKLRQYDVVFRDAAGDPVWDFAAGTPSLTFDLRLLEDSEGVAAVHARATLAAPATPLDLDYRAPTVAYGSAAGAPVSRHAPCTVGPPGALDTTPCPLTDADFATTLDMALGHRPGSSAAAPTSAPSGTATPAPAVPSTATVDTGDVRAMTFVVVRGCATECAVDVSANGTGWAPLGSVKGDGSLVPAGGTAVARYVRLSAASGTLGSLREVSVWDAEVAPAGGTGLARPGPPPAGRRSSPARHRAPWWLFAFAVLLLLASGSASIVRLLTFRPLWKARSEG
jgi:hypothetical protein